ncbi:MAG: hypothetical protein ACLFOZ_14985 [Cyclobacteriaceae bacterium]
MMILLPIEKDEALDEAFKSSPECAEIVAIFQQLCQKLTSHDTDYSDQRLYPSGQKGGAVAAAKKYACLFLSRRRN